MAGESFTRPRGGTRFTFLGMKTNDAPDALPPGKYPYAQNIRSTTDDHLETRAGSALLTAAAAGPSPVTDMRAFTSLNTDGLPILVVRTAADGIYANGIVGAIGTLAGGGASPGAALIPFRPNQSPNPYMYIANGSDYQKFSAPTPALPPAASNVGIAEPQFSPEALPLPQRFNELLAPGNVWSNAGTAGPASSGIRSNEFASFALPDPAFRGPGVPPRWSVQVSNASQYQIGEIVMFNTLILPQFTAIVEDVIPPLTISLTVGAILYFAGGTGRCTLTLQGVTQAGGAALPAGESAELSQVLAVLRRGALIQIGSTALGNAEVCYVWSVATGPNDQISIETSTTATHSAGETITSVSTIVVNNVTNAGQVTNASIIGDQNNVQSFPVTVGIGTLTMGAGGASGNVVARPTVLLNGWGPNAHVGAYEMGIAQNYGWGLDPGTTSGYGNPGNAIDGNLATFADATGQHTHTYYGCVWSFASMATPGALALNINSHVLTNGEGGLIVTLRSAGIWYSLDGGSTWRQIYNQGPRPQQWDSVPLPASQDLSQVQVMAFTDSHDDMVQYVYEINITAAPLVTALGGIAGNYDSDDYIHVSLLVDNPLNFAEIKFLFDISDGTFQSNYLYYSVRPSDIVPATADTITQIAAVQAILQEQQTSTAAKAQGLTISAASVAGASQWTEIWFPISGLTRVGGDQTKSIANLISVQVLVNALATVNVQFSSLAFVGGGNPDVGDAGQPYLYRVRPRSSITGAVGNPSPQTRYGTANRRQPSLVFLPSAAYDPQIDTWDIFRFGGSVTSWRYIGSIPSTTTTLSTFNDDYFDDAAEAGDALDFDNFEPWPTIDVPFAANAQVAGIVALLDVPPPTNVLRFLPGNLVRIGGQNVYTLRSRPVAVPQPGDPNLVRFEFIENAGMGLSLPLNIYEPAIARQRLPYMFGPDSNGTVFACGDPLRAGTLYFAKPSAPDSAPDSYNQEMTPPSEPLLGGEILDGLAFVGSSARWWALYPQLNNPTQRYNPVQAPFVRGLAAPFGHCTDGANLYYFAEDGIRVGNSGGDKSLTDEDLYNLFPHEGVPGSPQTYGPPPIGHTVSPPDYSRAGTFRLTYCNGYLYALYQDSSGAYNKLVLDIKRNAWSVDVHAVPVSAMYNFEQQSGTLAQTAAPALYPDLALGDIQGNVWQETPDANDNGVNPIQGAIAVPEDPGGDVRAPKQWGDIFVDAAVRSTTGLIVQPMSLSLPIGAPATLPTSPTRARTPIDVGRVLVSDFLGMYFSWSDDFSSQLKPTTLFIYHASSVVQPARTIGWRTFGTSFGLQGYGHLRQVSMAYIAAAPVTLAFTTYDGQSPAPITLPAAATYVKLVFPFTANKGQLFAVSATSAAPFQFFLEDCELLVGGWARSGPYSVWKQLSGSVVDPAPI